VAALVGVRAGLGNVDGVTLPQSLFTPVNLGTFINGYKSQLPPSLLLYNPYDVLKYLTSQPSNADFKRELGYRSTRAAIRPRC